MATNITDIQRNYMRKKVTRQLDDYNRLDLSHLRFEDLSNQFFGDMLGTSEDLQAKFLNNFPLLDLTPYPNLIDKWKVFFIGFKGYPEGKSLVEYRKMLWSE